MFRQHYAPTSPLHFSFKLLCDLPGQLNFGDVAAARPSSYLTWMARIDAQRPSNGEAEEESGDHGRFVDESESLFRDEVLAEPVDFLLHVDQFLIDSAFQREELIMGTDLGDLAVIDYD